MDKSFTLMFPIIRQWLVDNNLYHIWYYNIKHSSMPYNCLDMWFILFREKYAICKNKKDKLPYAFFDIFFQSPFSWDGSIKPHEKSWKKICEELHDYISINIDYIYKQIYTETTWKVLKPKNSLLKSIISTNWMKLSKN